MTSAGIDWQREKWQSGLGSKFIHQGEKNAAKYADEVIVLSKGVQDYFKETYGRETHFIPNGVNRPQIREASLITDKFGLKKDSYILFLGRLVPEKGIRYLVEAFKNVKTDKKLVIAGGSSDTDSFMEELKELAKGDDRILFTGFVQGAMLDELYSNAYIYTLPSDLEGMPCAILFQRSPNHILTVELYFHRLVVIQINHADKSIHTFFCQPADVCFLTGLLCQSADFFIQFIGTLLFFLFCPYAILQCSQFFRKSLFLFYVRISQQHTVRIRFI